MLSHERPQTVPQTMLSPLSARLVPQTMLLAQAVPAGLMTPFVSLWLPQIIVRLHGYWKG
jgi:hypothetical protein